MTNLIQIISQVRGGGVGARAWVARIVGTDAQFGLAREFVTADRSGLSRSGKSGAVVFNITEPGVYEFRGVQHGKGRASIGDLDSGFIRVAEDGSVVEISRDEVAA